MGWFRIDDQFADHPKVINLRARKGWHGAMALWSLAGTWASRQLTDGFVPEAMISILGCSKAHASMLVEVGLWEREDGGYRFHDFHDFNPTRAFALEKKEKNRRKVDAWRKTKRDGNQVTQEERNQVTRGSRNQDVTPPPARPVPVPDPVPNLNRGGGADSDRGQAAPSPAPEPHTTTKPPSADPKPPNEWLELQKLLWREWVKRYESAKGNHPAKTAELRDVTNALYPNLRLFGVPPEALVGGILDLYWAEDWPNAAASRPTLANLQRQLDRLLVDLRAEWAEHLRPAEGAA